MASRNRTLGLKLRAIDKMSNVISRVQKTFPKLTRSIKRASRASQIFNAQTKRMRETMQKIGGRLQNFGRGMTSFVTLPIVAAGVAGVKMFADFQQGLRGIEKTTGLSRVAVRKLGKTFDQLSTEIPVSTAEMLELAQAGGQLGIKGVKNIEKFTVVMAKLGRAGDVSGEAGAKGIARILNVTGDGIGKIENFSSAIVALGNTFEASESEILGIANRVAGQIGRFDVASDKVLGIATALKALGKNAESSGSVVGRSFDAIDQAIKGGGERMQLLSKLTRIASKDLKKAFSDDAAAVFQKFVVGLNEVEKAEGNQIKVLAKLRLQGIRINDVLLTLAKRPEKLAQTMALASKAFKENTALQKEFLIQTDSFSSGIKTLTNTFTSLLRLIGEELAPTVSFLGKIFKGIFNFLRNNPTIRALVIVFGGLAAILGPVLILLGGLISVMPLILSGFAALSVTSLAVLAPFLLIPAAIAAVIAVGVILFKQWENIKAFFNENPFGQFIKFIFFVMTPIGKLISAVRLVVAAFSGLKAVKGVVRDILPDFVGDKLLGPELGPATGAKGKNKGAAKAGTEQTFKGNVDVNFSNVPSGTKIRSEASGFLGFNVGALGGIQ